MRKYAYLLLLGALAVASTACSLMGTTNSDFGYNGGSNNSHGAILEYGGGEGAVIFGATYVTGDNRQTWNQCTPGVLQQIETQLPAGLFGMVYDTGEQDAMPQGTSNSYVKDNSGNGLASARVYQAYPGDPNAVFSPGTGYVTGVYFDYGPTVFPCGEMVTASQWFQDDLIVRSGTIAVSSAAWDRSVFYTPTYNNDAANGDISLNDGLAHMSLAKRIELLRSLDTSKIYSSTTGTGRPIEVLPIDITALTIGNETFVPETPFRANLMDMKAYAFDPSDPAIKAPAAWVADQLEAALAAGTKPEISFEINGSTSISSADMGNAHFAWGQSTIDKFREIAGSPILGDDSGRTSDGSRSR